MILLGSSSGVLVPRGQASEVGDGAHGGRAQQQHQHHVFPGHHLHGRDLEVEERGGFALRGLGGVPDERHEAFVFLGSASWYFVLLLATVDEPCLGSK